MFDRFWRGDAARSPCGTHYGLGLPICKVAIERLGGTIAASIAQGDVFTVTIRLPAQQTLIGYLTRKRHHAAGENAHNAHRLRAPAWNPASERRKVCIEHSLHRGYT